MKINWKLRFQNKATLAAIITGVVAFVYQLLSLFGVTPGVSENQIAELASVGINVLCLLGIVTDPTTKGLGDSEQALTYTRPKEG